MNDRETLDTELNVFADFNPKLPDNYTVRAVSVPREYPAGIAEIGKGSR